VGLHRNGAVDGLVHRCVFGDVEFLIGAPIATAGDTPLAATLDCDARVRVVHERIERALDDLALDVASAIAAEKASDLADRDRRPDWTLGERRAAVPAGDYLQGTPGSPGSAEGEAFVVLSSDDFARFP